jgi:hypothetical protein
MEGRCCVDAEPVLSSLAAVVEDGVGGLRVMLRVPVDEAGVVIPTVGAVVEDVASAGVAPDN